MELNDEPLKGNTPLQRLPIGVRIAGVAIGVAFAHLLPLWQWLGLTFAHNTGAPLPFQLISRWMQFFQFPFFINVFTWMVILVFMVDHKQRRQFSNWFLGVAVAQLIIDSTLRNADMFRNSPFFQVEAIQIAFGLLYVTFIGALRGMGLSVGLGARHLVGRTVLLFAAIELLTTYFHSYLARKILQMGTVESMRILQLISVGKAILIGIVVAFAVFWLRQSAVRRQQSTGLQRAGA